MSLEKYLKSLTFEKKEKSIVVALLPPVGRSYGSNQSKVVTKEQVAHRDNNAFNISLALWDQQPMVLKSDDWLHESIYNSNESKVLYKGIIYPPANTASVL